MENSEKTTICPVTGKQCDKPECQENPLCVNIAMVLALKFKMDLKKTENYPDLREVNEGKHAAMAAHEALKLGLPVENFLQHIQTFLDSRDKN